MVPAEEEPKIPSIIENDQFEVFKELTCIIRTTDQLSVERALGAICEEF